MQPTTSAQATASTAPELTLPWPCWPEGRTLFLLAAAPGGRGRSLGRFFSAVFLALGLLLLLVGTQKNLPPALAGGSACIFAGIVLLCAVRSGRAPLLILDGARGEAVLCRRRLGHRTFRLLPLGSLEIFAAADGREVRIRSRDGADAGREIPELPSRVYDAEWRQGMALPTPAGDAAKAASALDAWRRFAGQGEAPAVVDACDRAEFAALLGGRLPHALLRGLTDVAQGDTPLASGDEETDEAWEPEEGGRAALREPRTPRPEIRRAPDLRDATGARDKRD